MAEYALNMLKLRDSLPPKPRKLGLFVGTEQAMPLGFQEDLLESHGDIIDYVKFGDHAGLASRYSEAWLKKKLDIYRRHNVRTFIGGIGYELAALQGTVDQFFRKNQELGFTTVEISEDTITPLPPKERAATVKRAISAGLEVFTEIGVKYPEKPLEVNEAIDAVKADLEAGAATVTIEIKDMIPWGETVVTNDTDARWAAKLIEAVGLDTLVFECYPPQPWTAGAAWLIHHFGMGVNLAHIDVDDCLAAYAMRMGMTRPQGFPGMFK